MSDTIGSLCDKLCTVGNKMFNVQEGLYKIRRMSFDEFKQTYGNSEEGLKELFICFQKSCDLNMQRNQLIDEIDKKIVEMINSGQSGEDLDNGAFVQRKHKTY